jgi:hypothetical protein
MDPLDVDLAKMATLAERISFTKTRRFVDEQIRSRVDLDDPEHVARMLYVGQAAKSEAVAALAAELWLTPADQQQELADTRLEVPVHPALVLELHHELEHLGADEATHKVVDAAVNSWRPNPSS